MLIDQIKKANIEAMKAHDSDARAALSIVISKYTELKTNGSGKEVTDADVVLLATPPGFRPMMFKAAVEAGKYQRQWFWKTGACRVA